MSSAAGVKSAGRRTSDRSTSGSSPSSAYLSFQAVVVAAISFGFLWLVWIYGNGLRDPRYLDGWVLAGGMSLQIGFHIAIKTAKLTPASAMRWRKFHVFLGYLLIAAFISHSDFSLPDTGFEWALWMGFLLVTLSGVIGTYLGWSLKAKRLVDDDINHDRIPTLRAELARNVEATVADSDPSAATIGLPKLPHESWITDLYANHLRDFFAGQRNVFAHLIGSQHPLKRLIDEIDSLSRYVDKPSQEKLAAIKILVVEKDRLDFAGVYLWLTKCWLFVHVPVTYALIVLSAVHIVVVYAFSSGAW